MNMDDLVWDWDWWAIRDRVWRKPFRVRPWYTEHTGVVVEDSDTRTIVGVWYARKVTREEYAEMAPIALALANARLGDKP